MLKEVKGKTRLEELARMHGENVESAKSLLKGAA
jgi:hypothetical protein